MKGTKEEFLSLGALWCQINLYVVLLTVLSSYMLDSFKNGDSELELVVGKDFLMNLWNPDDCCLSFEIRDLTLFLQLFSVKWWFIVLCTQVEHGSHHKLGQGMCQSS